MFARTCKPPDSGSFFVFGPRGTGKSTLLRSTHPGATWLDLLDLGLFAELSAHPERLEGLVRGGTSDTVVIDEVQRLPALLDGVHRLIEEKRWRFFLTGSSARKLRRGGANLLAGRARTLQMHPMTAEELGSRWQLDHALRHGMLPTCWRDADAARYLSSYVGTYLQEEVRAEAMTRSLEAFSRFLAAASISQAGVLSISAVSREAGLPRKTVEGYFELLGDLLLGVRLPVFTRRAKRTLAAHDKFYFFDAGVYRALRPRGPLDSAEEIDGAALETLVMQQLRAVNDNAQLGYALSYWRTLRGDEVDFVLYGERGLHALEVKRAGVSRESDLAGLRKFKEDHPVATCWLLYGGSRRYEHEGIRVVPVAEALPELGRMLGGTPP